MADANEPDSEQTSTTAKPQGAEDETVSAPIRKSRWAALNRTNRIAAVILGGVTAVFLAALTFGAGVIVGTEFSDSEGHHHDSETSDYRDGGDDASGCRGDGGVGANRDENEGDSRGDGDQSDSDQQPASEEPKPSAPTTPKP
jgi:hypothetical protein